MSIPQQILHSQWLKQKHTIILLQFKSYIEYMNMETAKKQNSRSMSQTHKFS